MQRGACPHKYVLDKVLLENQVAVFQNEIRELKTQNTQLASSNQQLEARNASLNETLQNSEADNSRLQSEKQHFERYSGQLEDQNQRLNATVIRASVIPVQAVDAYGFAKKSNGKHSKRRSASKAEGIDICFMTQTNELGNQAEPFYLIRIIDPQGQTLAIETMGSGTFKNKDTGSDARYTLKKNFIYEGGNQEICSSWIPGQAFNSGQYQVEIFHNGHLAGRGSLNLK